MRSFWARLDYNVKVRSPIVLGVALLSMFITGELTTPVRRATEYAPVQPIRKYSHQQHAGEMKIDCRYCHTGAEVGRFATVPAVSVCMNCHVIAAVDSPDVARLRALYHARKAVMWARVHRLPEFVYFTHAPHVAAGIDCQVCHDDVARMQVIRQARPLPMGWCLGCHRHPNTYLVAAPQVVVGPENCTACHR